MFRQEMTNSPSHTNCDSSQTILATDVEIQVYAHDELFYCKMPQKPFPPQDISDQFIVMLSKLLL